MSSDDANWNKRVTKPSSLSTEEATIYSFGLKHKGYNNVVSGGNDLAQKFKYNGKELEQALGYRMYEYEARHFDASLARFVTIDPLADDYSFQTPYAYAVNSPIRFIDKLGMAPDDVILRGSNGSSITLVTDLVDLDVDASSLGVDFGGNYSFEGDDILVAGLDIAGIFDPTGAADIAAGSIEMKNGNFWSGIASYAGVAPLVGDAAKLAKIPKHIKTINKAIDAVKSGKKANGADFVVTPKGTAVPTSQSTMRKGFDDAGFNQASATKTAENGQIYTVPTKNGNIDVRTMEGSGHHPKRAIFTESGTNNPVKVGGEKFRNNESKKVRREQSHLNQNN